MAYKDERIFELKVGIFIAIGISILLIIIFSIGDVYLLQKGYHIKIVFNFVNGISESAPVRLAGVNVGKIDKIDIFRDKDNKKTKVQLTAWIENEDIKIERDSIAIINTLGLLGEKYLEIFPGDQGDDVLKNMDVIIGEDPIATEYLTRKASEVIESTTAVMNRLKDGKGTIGKLLVEEKIYDDLEAFVADIKQHPWKLLHKPSRDR